MMLIRVVIRSSRSHLQRIPGILSRPVFLQPSGAQCSHFEIVTIFNARNPQGIECGGGGGAVLDLSDKSRKDTFPVFIDCSPPSMSPTQKGLNK